MIRKPTQNRLGSKSWMIVIFDLVVAVQFYFFVCSSSRWWDQKLKLEPSVSSKITPEPINKLFDPRRCCVGFSVSFRLANDEFSVLKIPPNYQSVIFGTVIPRDPISVSIFSEFLTHLTINVLDSFIKWTLCSFNTFSWPLSTFISVHNLLSYLSRYK